MLQQHDSELHAVLVQDTPSHHVTSTVEVQVVGRRFPPATFQVSRQCLESHSKVIKDVIEGRDERPEVEYIQEKGVVRISDGGDKYNHIKTFNHMAPEVMERLLEYMS